MQAIPHAYCLLQLNKITGAPKPATAEGIIGKQVQILYDLVTVLGEQAATRFAQSLIHSIGKAAVCEDP